MLSMITRTTGAIRIHHGRRDPISVPRSIEPKGRRGLECRTTGGGSFISRRTDARSAGRTKIVEDRRQARSRHPTGDPRRFGGADRGPVVECRRRRRRPITPNGRPRFAFSLGQRGHEFPVTASRGTRVSKCLADARLASLRRSARQTRSAEAPGASTRRSVPPKRPVAVPSRCATRVTGKCRPRPHGLGRGLRLPTRAAIGPTAAVVLAGLAVASGHPRSFGGRQRSIRALVLIRAEPAPRDAVLR